MINVGDLGEVAMLVLANLLGHTLVSVCELIVEPCFHLRLVQLETLSARFVDSGSRDMSDFQVCFAQRLELLGRADN